MKRRQFIILTGIGATSAGLLTACGHPEEKLIPALIPDDEYVPGIDVWKTSTCALCDAGCGILVRTRDHKANKIEGNPQHPVNRGALCAKGQAGLQVLYNPDRIKAPLKRTGERFSGQFAEISWDEAIKTLADKLREIKAQGQADKVIFASSDLQGVTGVAVRSLVTAYDAAILAIGESSRMAYEASTYTTSYGSRQTPVFDIANATYLLSFGARFLETWHSPMRYSLAYGEFRRAKGRARGRFVQVEPRMSLTAANADEWLAANVGTEGFVAMAMAQVMIRENLVKDAPQAIITNLDNNASGPKATADALADYAPEKTQEITGIPAEKIIRIAREFAAAERPLAIGGGTAAISKAPQGPYLAVNFLNTLRANINKPGGVLLPAYEPFDLFAKVRSGLPTVSQTSLNRSANQSVDALPDRSLHLLSQGQPYSALLIHQLNPIFSDPRTTDTIKAIPFIASFSAFMDETSQLADLVLPDQTSLENWNARALPLADKQVALSLTRPVVKPEHQARQAADVLLALCRELKPQMTVLESAEAIVRQAVIPIVNPNAGKKPAPKASGEEASDEEAEEEEEEPEDEFKVIAEPGFWVGAVDVTASPSPSPPQAPILLMAPDEAKEIKEEYPFLLLAYEHATLGFGEQANLPLLQELPDPMTSVVWGSWVEINPKTAARLNIKDGDLLEVSSAHGTVRVPAVLYPAIHPEVLAMPYGQGHSAYGRFARDKGATPISLNPYGAQADTSAVRVRIQQTAGDGQLVRYGTNLPEHIEIKR